MDNETCTVCNIEKHINNFYKKIQKVKVVISKEVLNLPMIRKIKYQFNKRYIMKKIEIDFYRNRMITETKETQIINNYLDHMLNKKTN